MMRLPRFQYHAPASIAEAAKILATDEGASILGGGTDLFPNMKRRHQEPATLVSLRRVDSVRGLARSGDASLRIGASMTLADLAIDERAPAALRRAAAQVASAQIRNAATIGGNICLDTRCTYYDQNFEWREAIGFCMKKQGTTCWVAPSSDRCLAVSSTDCAPALIALDAEVELVSTAGGERRVKLADLYRNDGMEYLTRRRDEILAAVALPARAGLRSTYWKLRRRGSIDFPVLGVAVALEMDGAVAPGRAGIVRDARIVLGAVASSPQVASDAAALLVGQEPTDELVAEAARLAGKLARPMDNTDFQLHWRKAVVEPFVAGALKEMRGDDAASFGPLARRAARAVFATT